MESFRCADRFSIKEPNLNEENGGVLSCVFEYMVYLLGVSRNSC